MDIRISGRHFEITDALKQHVEKRVENFEKYLHTIIDVHVILSVEKYRHCAEISVFGKRLKFTEKSVDTDMYSAIDKVCVRVEKALRRHKDKIKVYRKKDNKKRTVEAVAGDINS
ncbi:MAG: ribosome-associated translation inhibitor RaiA [Candidatus Omnitrophica bacterium]|nr:ribosome-associated translation inhibitor RaiA [Candidatus Omnitrophota bacterium]MBU4478134.1 ribosome-associated translation inhibitor RaiA [Candidatus Omnitrophota bacterium]MCG2704069.1 ribosome-associated translation inhibitor RaiA [Candidatus Omnitrophota bacterium]